MGCGLIVMTFSMFSCGGCQLCSIRALRNASLNFSCQDLVAGGLFGKTPLNDAKATNRNSVLHILWLLFGVELCVDKVYVLIFLQDVSQSARLKLKPSTKLAACLLRA